MTEFNTDDARNVDEVEDRIIAFENANVAPDKLDVSNIANYTSQFDDVNVVNRTRFINIESSQGLTGVRDVTDTANGGHLESHAEGGEIHLATDAQADSLSRIDSARWGQYVPGYEAQVGVGARLPQQPTEDGEILWGYFNGDDGFYFGLDSNEMFVAERRNGTEVKRVYRSNWNGRDPDEVEGVTHEPEDGAIYQINYAWYGYGSIQFSIISSEDEKTQQAVTVHTFSTQGSTSITNPNQPIRMQIDNGASGNAIDAYLGGRQYSILGDVSDNFRVSSQTVLEQTADQGAWTHVMSIRRKTTDTRRVNMLVDSLSVGSDSSVRFALLINPTLSGTAWQDYDLIPEDETISEYTEAGTFDGIGDGIKIYSDYVDVSVGEKTGAGALSDISIPIPRSYPITVVAQGIGGTADVNTTLRVQEKW